MTSLIRRLASIALSATVVAASFAALVIAVPNAQAAANLTISCGNVSVNGNVWTLSGTWDAQDFAGQSNQYDVAVFSPAGTAVDTSSKDSPDTFATTSGPANTGGGPQDEMAGTWSNQVTFVTPPTSITASLYHAQLSGNESSTESTCVFVLPPQTATLTLQKAVVNDNGGTAVDTAWTLRAIGSTTISGPEGSSTVTNATVPVGTFALSELGGPAGYTGGTYSCVKNTAAPVVSNTISLASGDTATCTITNDDVAPSLTLNKIVVNNNSGTSTESAWTLTAAGPSGFSGPGAAGSADVVSTSTFAAGTYTLSESAGPAGYTPSAWSCTNGVAVNGNNQITLANGSTTVCTITNDDNAPTTATLTLQKVVTNDNAGTAVDTDWTLAAAGPTPISGAEGSTTVTNAAVLPGSYTLTESAGPAGYTASTTWVCSGATVANNNQITLEAGDTATCSILNNDNAPVLPDVTVTLHKYVDGAHADATSAEGLSFPMQSSWSDTGFGNGSGSFSLAPAGYDATTSPMDQGADYSASELTNTSVVGPNCANNQLFELVGYSWGDSEAAAAAMAPTTTPPTFANLTTSKHIIVWNADCTPTLTVNKVVINDNGGTATTSSFTLFIDGATTTSGTVVDVSPGAHTVSETASTSYTGTIGGACDTQGSVTLAAGEDKVCTITNNDNAPAPLPLVKVTIVKNIGGAHATSGSATSASFPMQSSWNAVNLGGPGSGTYALSTVGFNTANAYEAVTSDMTSGSSYATNENTSTSVVGPNCANGQQFRLSGYSSGDSLAAAQSAATSSASPTFSNITSDKFVIVWNVPCALVVPPAPTLATACDTPTVAPTGYTLRNGTSGSDNVILAPNTMFVGKGGNDTVVGGDGNYIVCLGPGNDRVTLGNGNQIIDAGTGGNIIVVGDGTGIIKGGSGNDRVTAGSGVRTIDVAGGGNIITTGEGSQNITTGSGNDKINAGGGIDTCSAGGGTNTLISCEL